MTTRLVSTCVACAVLLTGAAAEQTTTEAVRGPDRLDTESGRLIRQYTTDPSFLTSWVDHIPESESVPSPRDHFGTVIGAPGVLHRPDEIVGYFRELEKRSPRVQVFSMGRSHGGREMIVAAIADAQVLDRLPEIKAANRRLADPRRTTEEAAHRLAHVVPPIYYMTAGLHSPETGPPEMVMELAYRLAVSEQEWIREIRQNVVTLITPVLEMDGRAREVDWYYRFLEGAPNLDDIPPRSPSYWGHYTLHDNNRDGLQVSQPLTRNYTETFHEYLPVVSLDLHESVPLLYVSTGTGPYNETIDPITITEWQWLASYDVNRATRLGLPGVWTWGFYTGWYPGYLLWVTNNHNAVGRFYETFGNSLAGTFERDLRRSRYADERVDTRQWYRARPPATTLDWSLRNNTNYMQTGVLASLQLAARNGETLLMNFWRKGANSLHKGRTEPPYAFHVPAEQRDPGMTRYLLWLLEQHRIEVHRAMQAIELDGATIDEGDFVVRMDQPYRNFAKTLLDRQVFPETADHTPYDDVSWNLGLMLGLDVREIDDPAVQQQEMPLLESIPDLGGRVEAGRRWIVDHRGQASLAGLAWALRDGELAALAEAWEGHPAGSLVVSGVARETVQEAAGRFRLDAQPAGSGNPRAVSVDLPRVAVYHTWYYTQDSGWVRYTLEQLGIPFTLIDKDDVRAGDLGRRFDVILVPNQYGGLKWLVQGIDRKWSPMPYTKTAEFPSHGVIDSSPDITGGMGFEGLAHLQRFVEEGGLLITLGNAGVLVSDSGIARPVDSAPPAGTPGSHVTTKVLRPEHPVTWGYDEVTHVFRGDQQRFDVDEYWRGMVLMQYGTKTRAEVEREEDRKAGIPTPEPEQDREPVEEEKPDEKRPALCLSGIVNDPGALERRPAILDVPVGEGRVLIYSWNPMHRYQNHHDFAFVTNALLFHDDLPATPTEEEMRAREE
jgi:hypothetical protein